MSKFIPLKEEVFITDRSAIETDWHCGMAYWWNRLEGERGIVPVQEMKYFQIGREIHEDLAFIGQAKDISVGALEEFLTTIHQPTSGMAVDLEPWIRRLGWIAAFTLYIEPVIRRDWNTVGIEREIVLDRDPLWLGLIPDRVLESKSDGKLAYREWKSVGAVTPGWVASWPTAVQVHAGIKAIEEELGRRVAYGQIQGLYKGYEKGGLLRHPYVWAYTDGTNWQVEWKKGWSLAPIWEFPGGIIEWVMKLGSEVALDLFPMSAPIFVDERLLDSMVRRRVHREREVREVRDRCQGDWNERVLYFEQRFKNCRPVVGSPCAYLPACFNASVNKDPLGSGLFVPRTPHHELEIIGVDDDE